MSWDPKLGSSVHQEIVIGQILTFSVVSSQAMFNVPLVKKKIKNVKANELQL